ncbi:MAG: DUF2589 domain-containing protein [Crocinitomicaceae bacterium]|nr:DUF2589 domain-containing protein [Crocinitomicaceae bacterium]
MSNLKLDDLITSVSDSITKVHERIEAHDIEMFKNYMDLTKNEEGVVTEMKPHMVKIALPNKDGEFVPREIPIIALANVSSLELDKVKVKISFNAGWGSDDGGMDVNVGSTKKREGRDGSAGMRNEIEICYMRDETPEGLAKITNEFTKVI